MNGIWGHVIGIVIVMLMLAFVGIWVWVWRPRHRRKFARLSKLPLEDSTADGPREGG
jgi:cytochrome c oxidase cbb3-type subunit IV